MRRHWLKLVVGLGFLLVNNYVAVQIPVAIGRGFDHLTALVEQRGDSGALQTTLWLIAGLSALCAIMLFLRRLLMITASRDMEFDFRNDVFARLQDLSPSYFDRHPTGDLMSRATNDLDAIRDIMGPGIMYMADSLTVFPIALVAMAQYSGRLTALALIPIALFGVLVKLVMGKIFLYSKLRQDLLGEISALTQENLSGARVVKAYCQQDNQIARFTEVNQRFIAANLALARTRALFQPSIQLVVLLGFALLLTFGGSLVARGSMGLGELVAFVGIYRLLIWPVLGFGFVLSLWQRGAAAMERIEDILSARSDVATPPPADDEPPLQGGVEFRNLTFTYPGADTPALCDITLSVAPGQSLGIIGPTGSGKTSIVSLLPHFYPVERGQVFIDGRDLNDIPLETLRRAIGYVPQENFLFSDTIRGNVAFCDPDAVQNAAVDRAVQVSRLSADVDNFPQGLETMLGERGINLSGGQKQRAAIARAVFRNPQILILDDALSAVDTETEDHILSELRAFMQDRTTILISHRVSTVRLCSQIVVIDGGRIIESGAHESLLERDGMYARIFRNQQLAEELEMVD